MSTSVLDRPTLRIPHPVPAQVTEDCRGDGAISVSAGSVFYGEGDCAGAVYLLLSGRVRLSKLAAKFGSMVTGLVRPGMLFGLDVLSQSAYGETARAEMPCLVRIVPLITIDRLIQRQPGFAAMLMEALVRRRTAAESLLTRALLANVPGRLAGALLDAADGGVVTGLTRRQLAEAAWTTRETATRVLFHLAADGMVRVDRRHIELLDERRLRALAAGARHSTAG